MIGLSLAGILLAALFSFLTQSIKTEQACESAHAAIVARQRIQVRLQDLFMMVAVKGHTPLYTARFPKEKQDSLLVSFDNGIDPDPAYSGMVTGRLYLDEESQFCLALWPIEEETLCWRKEILLPKVKSFSFEFLGQKKKATDKAVGAAYAWHSEWGLERVGEIPSQIRLYLHDEEGPPLFFAFCLATPEPTITYWEKAI